MQLTLTLDQEQSDALQERVDLYNAGSGQPALTANQFLVQVHNLPFIDGLVATKRQQTALELKAAADALPYEKRAELAQINRDFILANA